MDTKQLRSDDLTTVAIRNAHAEGRREAAEEADHRLALRVAEARLDAARKGLDASIAALVKCPMNYATDDGKGNDSYGEGRSIHSALVREREAIDRRIAEVTLRLGRAS